MHVLRQAISLKHYIHPTLLILHFRTSRFRSHSRPYKLISIPILSRLKVRQGSWKTISRTSRSCSRCIWNETPRPMRKVEPHSQSSLPYHTTTYNHHTEYSSLVARCVNDGCSRIVALKPKYRESSSLSSSC